METCINYCNDKKAFVSSDERRWINRVHKLNEEYPEEVRIIRQPEQNDGCIYATVPVKWVRINPPKKVNLTEEQKDELRKRARRMSEHKQSS